ncbi:MAG: DNA alkylation repair protein [Gemmataceae bacterium]
MTAAKILDELKTMGSESIKKVLMKHGAQEPIFGVKIEDMKKIVKRIKKDHQLALELYDTGVYDAMYLAGLIADDAKMTKKDLNRWVKAAYCYGISEYTVPWVASSGPHGWDLALEWIESKKESIAAAGWATLSCIVAMKENDSLDLDALKKLLARVEKTIEDQPNRVRSAMNGFVISIGGYVKPLSEAAISAAKRIGKVKVDVGDTSCKIPDAVEYIEKMKTRGSLEKKRKTVKC